MVIQLLGFQIALVSTLSKIISLGWWARNQLHQTAAGKVERWGANLEISKFNVGSSKRFWMFFLDAQCFALLPWSQITATKNMGQWLWEQFGHDDGKTQLHSASWSKLYWNKSKWWGPCQRKKPRGFQIKSWTSSFYLWGTCTFEIIIKLFVSELLVRS